MEIRVQTTRAPKEDMALTDQIKDDMICVGVTRDMARRPEGVEKEDKADP